MTAVAAPRVATLADVVAATAMAVAVFFICLIFLLSMIGGFESAQTAGPGVDDVEIRLAMGALAAIVAGAALYQLRRSGWSLVLAVLVIALTGSSSFVLYAVTAPTTALPLLVALAGLVAAIKVLRQTGDVQAQIRLGMALALLPFGGAVAMPILPVVALYGALLDPDARRRPMVLFAMFLVMVIPAVIVAIGIAIFQHRTGAEVTPFFSVSYWQGLASHGAVEPGAPQPTDLGLLVPVLALTLLIVLFDREGGRLQGAVALVLLPAYLEGARFRLGWDIPDWLPMATFLAATLALLAACSLPRRAQVLACCVTAVVAYLSWQMPGPALDTQWRAAIERPILLLVMTD